MSEWPIEIEEKEFQPIPESWIKHPLSVDSDNGPGPRIYAVSAHIYRENWLHVRYGHSASGRVWTGRVERREIHNGVVPIGLDRGTFWQRSLQGGPLEPDSVLRKPEIDHFREIWGNLIDIHNELKTVEKQLPEIQERGIPDCSLNSQPDAEEV